MKLWFISTILAIHSNYVFVSYYILNDIISSRYCWNKYYA